MCMIVHRFVLPTKVVRSRSTQKNCCMFHAKSGHVATTNLEDRRTVNAKLYITLCLPEVINE